MQVELGDAKELAQIVKMGVGIIQELNNDGTLPMIEQGFFELRGKLRAQSVALDIMQYEKYVEAGMKPEHAVIIIASQKGVWKPDFSRIFSKK